MTAVFLAALPLAGAESFLGTWRLNVEKSEFLPEDVRYQEHKLTWEIVGKQLHYREEGIYADGRKFGDGSEFTAEPNGPAVKPAGQTTYARPGEMISLEVFGDDMLWINAVGKNGKVSARWMVVLKAGGKQLVISQITGGSGTRVFDRAE